MPIKNYTTSVAEEKTVGEISGLLAAKGARQVQISYDEQCRPSAVSFIVLVKQNGADSFGIPVPFKLPCNFDGVLKAMVSQFKDKWTREAKVKDPKYKEQSRRVAWRIVKDWVEAQMALIEAEQASLVQVFLPYAVTNVATDITVFDQFMLQISNQKSLTSGDQQ